MHLILLMLALIVAWLVRLSPIPSAGSQSDRWHRTMEQFLFPPLLLLTTAIALVVMGPQGQMGDCWEGWLSDSAVLVFLVGAVGLGLKRAVEGGRSLRQVCSYPTHDILGRTARLLPTPIPFAAQVGFWRSELVISQGLLDTFDAAHLEAILTHEQAHHYFHDTFWFFWLGWLRQLTGWLPQTEILWQELLFLREQRADLWAVQQVDGLLLAESVFQMVSSPELYPQISAAFGADASRDRLTERINTLLGEPEPLCSSSWQWLSLVFALLPLLSIPFHY